MIAISSVLLLTLALPVTLAHPENIFHISVLESPAPPPDQGPPISASALRDKSKLPFEIVGIICAYLLWAGITVVLILFFGNRLRRRKQTSSRVTDMEVAKPRIDHSTAKLSPPPTSPSKHWPHHQTVAEVKPWTSPQGGLQHKISHASVSTFDDKVIESDKARNQNDLERLYAAVMENEDRLSRTERNSEISQASPTSPTQYPPEFDHLRNENNDDRQLSHPLAPSPLSETDVEQRTASRASRRFTPLSFLSGHSRTPSSNSNRSRPKRISIRGQEISAPITSPDLTESVDPVQDPPLSPRIYAPGPPPPAPIHKSAAASARELDSQPKLRAAAPAPLSLSTRSSSNTLPFRQAYASPPQSAPPTKTTYLEKRDSRLYPGPKTGVPHTPYSPYMPYTPVTPITPGRLVTKEERKFQQKWVAKKVLSEDDVVRSDEDMWQ